MRQFTNREKTTGEISPEVNVQPTT